MKRYNLFHQVHKGLRAMLYEAALALQRNDFNDRTQTISLFNRIEELLGLLHDHSHQEDQYILPAVRKANEKLVREFDSEHKTDECSGHRLKQLMCIYRQAVSDMARQEAGEATCQAFNELIAFNLEHMNKEEEHLNPLLWASYKDEQLMALNEVIMTGIPAEKMAIQASWVMRGINNEEIIQWLKTIKNGTRDFVFCSMLALAQSELPPERWNKIQEVLCEGSLCTENL